MTTGRAGAIVWLGIHLLEEESTMELTHPVETEDPIEEDVDHERLLVHEWRAAQLERLGIPHWLADVVADRIDWHEIARLVERGCPPRLALDIVR